MTPFQLYMRTQAYYERVKKDNIINIRTYNVVKNMFGGKDVEDFDDIFGVDKTTWLQPQDFASLEEYNKYLEREYLPYARERGLING